MSALDMSREPVILNVYDMFWTNDYTSNVGVGVYHSGLEVYGREYAYGEQTLPLKNFILCLYSISISKFVNSV